MTMPPNAKDRCANWSCPWNTGFLKYQFFRDTVAGEIRFTERTLRIWEARTLANVKPRNMSVLEVWSGSVIIFVGNCKPDPLVGLQLVLELANKCEGILGAEAISLSFL
jgi:hypothetical protein